MLHSALGDVVSKLPEQLGLMVLGGERSWRTFGECRSLLSQGNRFAAHSAMN